MLIESSYVKRCGNFSYNYTSDDISSRYEMLNIVYASD